MRHAWPSVPVIDFAVKHEEHNKQLQEVGLTVVLAKELGVTEKQKRDKSARFGKGPQKFPGGPAFPRSREGLFTWPMCAKVKGQE